MIPLALIISLGLLVLSVLVLVLARSASLQYDETRTHLHQHPAKTLEYEVVEGQDPADVIVALTHAGYTAVEDLASGRRRVLVLCPHGRAADRSEVRAVIEEVCAAGAIGNSEQVAAVVFADEG